MGWTGAVVTTSGHGMLRSLTRKAIEVFRNVPALVQMFFVSFALPLLLPRDLRVSLLFDNQPVGWLQSETGVHAFYFGALLIVLSTNTAAYLADIFRAGIESVESGQIAAGLSTGLSQRRVMRSIVLPQALAVSMPALSTRLVHNMKNTALAVFIPVPDLFSALQTATSKSFRGLEFLIAGALIYLVLAWGMSRGLAFAARRWTAWAEPGKGRTWTK
jgi:ABC-type amino acid transport system permease subunit